ncbi:MAG: RsmD family RNA methyltransferase [Candidatus Caldarchaeum sp.]|nr:RsmD family RNA methyltransferase [Candidatus Caldarchaeum sp.]
MAYSLRPVKAPLLSGYEARQILTGESQHVSLDLGISAEKAERVSEGVLVAGRILRWDWLKQIFSRLEDVYVVDEGFSRLAWFDKSFYRLVVPGWRRPPTIEINGVRMHRTVGLDPVQDAVMKVSLFPDLSGAKVLDICTGLGYTAAAIAAKGAVKVVTVEKDVNVLKMAAYNPWSRGLFTEKIEVVLEDAFSFLEGCDTVFDAVMHDPPTVKVAGELYSLDFYRLVWKVLRKGGVLVHYVGQPDIKKGSLFYKGVMQRLRRSGFRPFYVPEALSVKALKV